MKKSLIIMLFLAAVLALGLAACGDRGDGSIGDVSQHEPEYEDIDVGDEVPGNFLIREDEEGLVTVRVGQGSADIYFNLDLWNLDTGQDEYTAGPFQIVTRSGAAVDAMVGKIHDSEPQEYRNLDLPAVAILTEHGRVEYFLADPAVGWQENEYKTYGVLPWLKDIESFTFEELYGDAMTIYAWDAAGLKYDIGLVRDLTNVFNEIGVWEFFTTNEYGVEMYLGMMLTEEGTMDLVLGQRYGDEPVFETDQMYSGTYEVFLAENGPRGYGQMDIRLDCTWWIAELDENTAGADRAYWDERMNIAGTYTFWTEGDGYLHLHLIEGDALMHMGWRGEPIETYNFWQTIFVD